MCVRLCVRASVRACVRVSVRAWFMRAWSVVRAYVRPLAHLSSCPIAHLSSCFPDRLILHRASVDELIEDIAMHSNIFIGVTSVLSRLGSFTIFLLLTDSSHETHFSTRQNMEPEDILKKKIKFFSPRVLQIFDSKHGSPENYSDFYLLLPDRGLCVLRAITSRRY